MLSATLGPNRVIPSDTASQSLGHGPELGTRTLAPSRVSAGSGFTWITIYHTLPLLPHPPQGPSSPMSPCLIWPLATSAGSRVLTGCRELELRVLVGRRKRIAAATASTLDRMMV